MKKRLKPYMLPILSGILIGTSYIPFPPWAIFFNMVPLWLFWLNTNDSKKIFIGSWITQFILNLIGFHWIAYTAVAFGGFPWIVGLFVLLLFCALAHLYFPISALIWLKITNKLKLSKTFSTLLIFPVFLLLDRLYPFIFRWHPGYTWLWARFPGFQLAEWIGFYGLYTFTLAINILLLFYWQNIKKKGRFNKYLSFAVASFFLINLAGFWVGQNFKEGDKTLKVLAVQGNIGNLEKMHAQHGGQYINKIVDTYLKLSQQGLEKYPQTDLIVWPETAFPETIYPHRISPQRRKLVQFLSQNNQLLFTGAYQRDLRTRKPYNAFVLMSPATILGDYQKTHLLAFGEYLPGGDFYPAMKKLLPMISDFGRGPGPSVIEHNEVKYGPQICYEGLFDEFTAQQQQRGAEILINITNDSWFGYPFETYQHMYMTLARAIEARRPLIRVTNTGISSAISAGGHVYKHSPHNQEWFHLYEVPYKDQSPPTLYSFIAPWWESIFILLIMGIIGGHYIARTRQY